MLKKMIQLTTILVVLCFFSTTHAQLTNAKVLINEVLPYPEDTIEAVEFVYIPENEAVATLSLVGWTIWDRLGVIYTFGEQEISQGDFFVITFYNKLRNTGDSVIIKDDQGVEQDSFSFENSKKSISYSRVSFDSNQFLETTPTIGEDNKLSLELLITPTLTPTINPTQEEVNTTTQDTESKVNYQQIQKSTQYKQKSQPVPRQDRHELLQNIIVLKKEIDLSYEKPLFIPPATTNKNFTTTLNYNTPIISSTGVISVIIGGLLFFVASRLIYE